MPAEPDPTTLPFLQVASDVPDLGEAPSTPTEFWAWSNRQREQLRQLRVRVGYLAVPQLGVASVAIGNSRRLAIKRSHTQGAALYAGVVGPPGSTKSPALELVVNPLDDIEDRLQAEWRQKDEEFKEELDRRDAGRIGRWRPPGAA
jgi:hypothetical protein